MKRKLLLFLSFLAICLSAAALQPERGYRGFVEWSNSLRTENYGQQYSQFGLTIFSRETMLYTGFTTAHGYQINPKFFVGAGLGMERCGKLDEWITPVFAMGRIDLKFGKFTPFGDIRLGANLSKGSGIYFSPSIGYRFNWGKKIGLNIGAGISLIGYKVILIDVVDSKWNNYEFHYLGKKHHISSCFSFRVGFDF